MAKKKISSQDFLNLMDEQESSEKVVFTGKVKPTAKPAAKMKKVKKRTIQDEWIEFASKNAPKFVLDIVAMPATQKLLKRIQSKL
jgi:uncharacterized protein (DUF1919 family)